ncbi:MAG: DNA cytosine methyltransferase [Chitinophagales bacterium]|nr:DNA cytosine methyltransferase [Chitinophagales bacterium]
MNTDLNMLTSLEICAGAGGQALGLEMAGFNHTGLVEIDINACETLVKNRPEWHVIQGDIKKFSGKNFIGVDLLAGGVPCPPFSVAGNQLGPADERDLFPDALRLAKVIRPKAIMLENVKGLFNPSFKGYRDNIIKELSSLGYVAEWKLLNASDYGVSQLRPRTILVAFLKKLNLEFSWPIEFETPAPTVGNLLYDLMAANEWELAESWTLKANKIAPTIVGGSKKHGGPDLGPTRAKKAWAEMGVDGNGIANDPPQKSFIGLPKLTVRMAARIQGFPDEWVITGKKTAAYRQVGNAFPPPVALAVGRQIAKALMPKTNYEEKQEALSYQ